MSTTEKKKTDHQKNSSEKDTNLNSDDFQKKYFQDSEDIEKDKPIHFKEEYDQNKNQIESSPDVDNENQSQKQFTSNKKEQEFVIEKNIQENNNQEINNKNNDNLQENNNIPENVPVNQYYDLLKEKLDENNDIVEIPNDNNNLNNYYYNYLNKFNNNKSSQNDEEEIEEKKVINFATKTYQGRIDPVKLNSKYNNYWKKQGNLSKSRQKYKQKIDELQKVFHPYGYKTITTNYKRGSSNQSRYSSKITTSTYDRPPFDNTKQPLPKKSYLVVPFDYGINDPNWGKEDPINYDRKKMAKLRMLKQPLKYYYPYTNGNIRKKNFKYE